MAKCLFCRKQVNGATKITIYNESNPHTTCKVFCDNEHYWAWVKKVQTELTKLLTTLRLERILKFRYVYRRKEKIINGLRVR